VASEAGPSTLGNGHGAAAPPSAAAVPDAAAAPAAVAASADGDWGRRAWQAALAEVEGILGDHARLACVATSGPNLLVVSFEAKYNFSKEFCERPAEATTLAAAASRVVGRPVELRFELLPPSASAAPDTPRRSGSKRQRMAERSEHPLVKRLGEVFQAHAVDID
jgi:hypothetical protein